MTSRSAAAGLCLMLAACGREFDAPLGPEPVGGVSFLAITPAAADLSPFGTTRFTARGGQEPYRFEFSAGGPASGADAQLDARSGAYTAGGNPFAEDHIRVWDATGNRADAVARTGAALAVTPAFQNCAPGAAVMLTASGGLAPYHFALADAAAGVLRTAATADGGEPEPVADVAVTQAPVVFTAAGAGLMRHEITVTDATGKATAVAAVQTWEALALQPARAEASPGERLTVSISGGQPPYGVETASAPSGLTAEITGGELIVSVAAGVQPGLAAHLPVRDAVDITRVLEIIVR